MGGVLGIDEAGRGPVIGPLILAGVLCGERQLEALERLRLKDSKRTSRPRRAELAREIAARVKIRLLAFPPALLEENLNQVELEGMARLVQGLNPQVLYLDAPVRSVLIPRYVQELRRRTGRPDLEVIAENGADDRYPVVSAASIVAKVYRDQAIERLRALYGDFGWGYPLEKKTRRFLEQVYARRRCFPPCVRTRWRTSRRVAAEHRARSRPPRPPDREGGARSP